MQPEANKQDLVMDDQVLATQTIIIHPSRFERMYMNPYMSFAGIYVLSWAMSEHQIGHSQEI
jgi:hypothetical protein